jgi:hypothetical protein
MAGGVSDQQDHSGSTPQRFDLLQLTWQDVPAFVTAIAGLSIALAVSRQLGFFWAVDLRLFSLFSVQDILSNSLSSFPLAIFGWLAGTLFSSAGGSAGPPPRIIAILFGSANPVADIKWSLITAVVLFLFVASWPFFLFVQMLFVFGPAALIWFRMKGVERFTWEIVYWLLVMALVFLGGMMEGQAELTSKVRDYELTNEKSETFNVRLMRATADAFLVSPSPSEVWVVPRDQVQVLKRKNLEEPKAKISIAGVFRFLSDRFNERFEWLKAGWPSWQMCCLDPRGETSAIRSALFVSSSSIWEALSAIGTLGAVLVALFGNWIVARLWPPQLRISLQDDTSVAEPTNMGSYFTLSRWCHIVVENLRRWVPARDVRILLQRVEQGNAQGAFDVLWQGEVPLQWSHQTMKPAAMTIGAPEFADLCSIFKDPAGRHRLELHPLFRSYSLETEWEGACKDRSSPKRRSGREHTTCSNRLGWAVVRRCRNHEDAPRHFFTAHRLKPPPQEWTR